MPRFWTDTQKQEASKRAIPHQPWKKSTGPRTLAGKAKSCMNALKHGQYCRQAYQFREALRHKINYIRFLCHKQTELFLFQRNELITQKNKKNHPSDKTTKFCYQTT